MSRHSAAPPVPRGTGTSSYIGEHVLANIPLASFTSSREGRPQIINHFTHKIPYIYKDIRHFINNLPNREILPKEIQDNFDDLIMESIRKTIMYDTFRKTMEEEGYGKLEEFHIGSLKTEVTHEE